MHEDVYLSYLVCISDANQNLQAYSYWLYQVPWGMYKALMYVKERYGNPTMILSENGNYFFDSHILSFLPLMFHKWVGIKVRMTIWITIHNMNPILQA